MLKKFVSCETFFLVLIFNEIAFRAGIWIVKILSAMRNVHGITLEWDINHGSWIN